MQHVLIVFSYEIEVLLQQIFFGICARTLLWYSARFHVVAFPVHVLFLVASCRRLLCSCVSTCVAFIQAVCLYGSRLHCSLFDCVGALLYTSSRICIACSQVALLVRSLCFFLFSPTIIALVNVYSFSLASCPVSCCLLFRLVCFLLFPPMRPCCAFSYFLQCYSSYLSSALVVVVFFRMIVLCRRSEHCC